MFRKGFQKGPSDIAIARSRSVINISFLMVAFDILNVSSRRENYSQRATISISYISMLVYLKEQYNFQHYSFCPSIIFSFPIIFTVTPRTVLPTLVSSILADHERIQFDINRKASVNSFNYKSYRIWVSEMQIIDSKAFSFSLKHSQVKQIHFSPSNSFGERENAFHPLLCLTL